MARRLAAEFVGTAFLLATVVGSGIMAETLSLDNVGVVLLGNTIATGAILAVFLPLVAAVVFVLAISDLSVAEILPIFPVILDLALLGTALAFVALYALLAPVR